MTRLLLRFSRDLLGAGLLGALLMGAPTTFARDDAATASATASDDARETDSPSLELARQLSASGRSDEAVAILLMLVEDPDTRTAATERLRNLLLTNPPRRAWTEAYAVALQHAPDNQRHALKVRAARAALANPDTRTAALRRLSGLLAERPDDVELRAALADAWLNAGRPARALATWGQRDGAAAHRGRVAALIALDRVDEALKLDEELVPTACRTARTRTACAISLREMGYPGAATASLRRALASHHRDLRSRSSKAGAWSTIATIEESQGDLAAATEAWQQAVAFDPDNRIYRDRLAWLLASTGRTGEARRLIKDEDGRLSRSVRAVTLVSDIDPASTDESVDQAIEQALELDPDNPVVLRAAAHWHISRGRPEAALQMLTPQLSSRFSDPTWLDLYVWAASEAQEPELAADALQRAAATLDDPRRWKGRMTQLADLQTFAAELAKARGDLQEAEHRYRLARAADPTSIRVLTGLGGVLWKRGRIDEAREVYRTALIHAPGNRVALFSLVEILRLEGKEGQARQLLLESGYDDLKVRLLESELAVMDLASDARRLRKAGQLDAAIARYRDLVARYPDQPALLHATADTLAQAGHTVEAAELYARARALDPDNPWLLLGEIRALVALSQPEEARRLLVLLPDDAEDDLAVAIADARRQVDRVEAERLLAEGREDAALALLERWAAQDDDPGAMVAIGELYLSRWQYGAASSWFKAALARNPDDPGAARGRVRALLGQGRLQQARSAATELVQRHPGPDSTELSRQVTQRIALERAVKAAASGDHARAERLLLDQIDADPDNLDLRVAHARLLLLRGEEAAAFRTAEAVLRVDPTHAEALSALQAAALRSSRSEAALVAFEEARSRGAGDWIDDQIQVLRLAARLDTARELYEAGPREAADQVVEQAIDYYGDGDARRWSLIGGAWLDLDRPQRAIEAFELALRESPTDPTAVVGLAGAWEARGQPARAEGLLSRHWQDHRHPSVGVALVQLQRRRDRPEAAARTLSQLEDVAGDRGVIVYAESTAPAPLPVVTPAGQPPPDDSARRPLDAPAWAAADVGSLRDTDSDRWPLAAAAGIGWAARPGQAGQQFLNTLYLPLGAALELPGPFALEGELIPVQLTDGQREVTGISMSAALNAGLPGGFGAWARLGTDSVTSPGVSEMTTWYVGADGRLGNALTVGVESGGAPVTDSLASWAGAYDANGQLFGRVRDVWAGGSLGYGWSDGSTVGALGRVGHASGQGGMGKVPWRQALAYGRTPLMLEGSQASWFGFEALVLDHDRQVDGFGAGQGGMFTPDLFLAGIARIEMAWQPRKGRVAACGLAGAGPQVVQGDQTLYLYPGTYVGYQLQGTIRAQLSKHWVLAGHGLHSGTIGAWGQTGVLAQLRYGGERPPLTSPSQTLGSLVHGPPLAEPQVCAPGWWEAP